MSNGYNGWSNYETWRVNLEIFDSYDPSDMLADYDFADGDRDKAIRDLAANLEGDAHDIIEMEVPEMTRGLAYDLAMSFLNRVDFDEIAEHMVDDYIAELV